MFLKFIERERAVDDYFNPFNNISILENDFTKLLKKSLNQIYDLSQELLLQN